MIRLQRDGFRWELQPEAEPWLDRLLQNSGRVIKETPAKRVTAHEAGGRTFYVKRYRHDAVPLRPLKFLFKPAPARKEWSAAQRLETLGVPVVRHLAHGECWSWRGLRESILITEGFEGQPLDQVTGLDSALALKFVEHMHERGVFHYDLHSGNLLARVSPPELRLVDVDKVLFRPAPVPRERDEMAAFLNISFPLPVTDGVRVLSARRRRQLLADRSRRCLRHNRDFAPRNFGRLRWHVRLRLLMPAVERVLAAPDEFLRSEARLLKPGQTTTVGVAGGLVLKRYNFRKWLNLAKDLARPSRAFQAVRAAYHLELAGVPTPRVVAAAERRALGLLLRSYVVMEEIPGARTLQRHLRSGHLLAPALVCAAAELIARLHNEGFTHGDLNERNLVLDAQGRMFLLDLDALKFHGEVPPSAAADDLARLAADAARHGHVTPANRRAFVRHYCRVRRLRRVPMSGQRPRGDFGD